MKSCISRSLSAYLVSPPIAAWMPSWMDPMRVLVSIFL